MKIIAHRGLWKTQADQNTEAAFQAALEAGFGIETDFRDSNETLVIAHDLPTSSSPQAEALFALCQAGQNHKTEPQPLAINIKADGLLDLFCAILKHYPLPQGSFFFDGAVPDSLHYFRRGLPVYTRQSEYEPQPSFYSEAVGVLLDEFDRHWITEKILEGHIRAGKSICIISPELHRRDFSVEWKDYRDIFKRLEHANISLCTDKPNEARKYFNL